MMQVLIMITFLNLQICILVVSTQKSMQGSVNFIEKECVY